MNGYRFLPVPDLEGHHQDYHHQMNLEIRFQKLGVGDDHPFSSCSCLEHR
ncbi:hypothetical protein Scep_021782 [Stephania cephalantha]|uniref:Uncharacterized protein n=1 Tax=Stephania cephalantha TaxID=152367 RepID=A0AAP0HX51_9MAGN